MNKGCLQKSLLLLLLSCFCVACSELTSIYQAPSDKTETRYPSSEQEKVILSQSIVLTPNFSKSYPINEKWISFNTGFMFTAPIEKESEVKKIAQTIAPKNLRFPGGTVANYYHPDGKGYGFKAEDVKGAFPEITNAMQLFDKNAIYHFADLCKMSSSNVVYVANLLTGTVEETIWAIDYFIAQKIPVVGIELGNEFYLQQYREAFPTVQTYISKAKTFAQVLKKRYPNIPLGVIAANATEPNPKNNYGKFQNEWNRTLGKESFYDFYIPHIYMNIENCEEQSQGDIGKLYLCASTLMSPELYQYHQVLLDHYKMFYGNKKMWITEWNMDGSGNVSNSILHAAYVSEFLLGLLDASIKHPEIDQAYFHNYGSGGYVAPIFTYTNDQKSKFFNKVDKIAYNTTYYSFYYFRRLINQKALRIQEQVSYPTGVSVKDVVLKSFVSPDQKTLYVYFINKSNKAIPLKVNGTKERQNIEGIMGNYPWSVAGVNGLKNNYPQHIDIIRTISNNKNSADNTIPGNSIGYIAFSL